MAHAQTGPARIYHTNRADTPWQVVFRDPTKRERGGRAKRVVKWFAQEQDAIDYRDDKNEQLLAEGSAGVMFDATLRADATAARRHLDTKGHFETSLLQLAQRYTQNVTVNSAAALPIDAQLNAFLDELRNDLVPDETVKNLKVRCSLWIDLAKLTTVGDITRDAVDVLRDRAVHPQTRRNDIGAASRFCAWLVERRRLDANPFLGVRRPKVHRGKPVVWELDELERLLAVAMRYRGGRYAAAIVVMNFVGGARPSELPQVAITYGRQPVARIEGGKLRGRANRTVPLSPLAVAWLTAVGKPTTVPRFTRMVRNPICRAAKVTWKKDICRHTFISNRIALVRDDAAVALESGTSPEIIHRHYHNVRLPAEARRWNALRPKRR